MATQKTSFSRYVAERKKNSINFTAAYESAKFEIAQTDTLDAKREQLHMTKSELAKKAGMSPAAVRRLFTAEGANPEIKTLLRLGKEVGFVLNWNISS